MKRLGLFRVTVLVICFAGGALSAVPVSAWSGPTANPPGNNVATPLNVGTSNQVKNAGLSVNALAVFGNTLLGGIAGSNVFLNFGATPGSAGYGIWDNAGTLNFKNSNGSWQSLQAIVAGLVGSGQWANSGSNIYNTNSGGGVGIGLTSPSAMLGVNGNISFEGAANNTTKGLYWYQGANGAWGQIYRDVTTGKLFIDSQGGTPIILNGNNTSGTVGVGTASPQQTLSVNGAMNIDQANGNNGTALNPGLSFGSGSGEGIASPRSGTNQWGLNFYTGWGNRLSITQGGNVGINTASPGAKLQVSSGDSPGILVGPNASWGAYLEVGGWRSGNNAAVMASNGNLHVDSKPGYGLYLNYFSNGGIDIGNGGGNTYVHNSLCLNGSCISGWPSMSLPANNTLWDTWYGSAYLASNGDYYMGWDGRWLSQTINQDVRSSAAPTFAAVNLPGSMYLQGTAGRNEFRDSENPNVQLRVGVAWGASGIYAENGNATVGASTGNVYIGSPGGGGDQTLHAAALITPQGAQYQNNGDIYMPWLGRWMSSTVNQDVRNGASPTFGETYTNGWFRLNGNGGIYWQNWNGGLYMSDGYWIRAYVDNGIWLNNGNFGTNGCLTIGFGGAGCAGGSGQFSGNVTAAAFLYSSDARLKTNVLPLSSGLADVMALRPVTYDWKDISMGQGTQLGFIAQEVQQVVPEVVHTDSKGMESIDYIKLVPILTKAIQEQQAQIAQQQQEIDQLKADVQALKGSR
jgi:hypothetical protein